jgi:hypothetical protein
VDPASSICLYQSFEEFIGGEVRHAKVELYLAAQLNDELLLDVRKGPLYARGLVVWI